MSESESQPSPPTQGKALEPKCTCELVANDKGVWELRADSSPECVATVKALSKSLGPHSREYLANHMKPNGEELQKAMQQLKRPGQNEA